jgi:hypothetical protein
MLVLFNLEIERHAGGKVSANSAEGLAYLDRRKRPSRFPGKMLAPGAPLAFNDKLSHHRPSEVMTSNAWKPQKDAKGNRNHLAGWQSPGVNGSTFQSHSVSSVSRLTKTGLPR